MPIDWDDFSDLYDDPYQDYSEGSRYESLYNPVSDYGEEESFYTEDPYENNPASASYMGMYDDPYNFDKYMELAKRQPPSERMYEEYLSRRPSFEKSRPSLGRTIGSTLVAGLYGLAGNPEAGIRAGSDIAESPFRKLYENWKTEGRDLATRARLADAQQGRELGAEKFKLEMGQKKRREEVKQTKDFTKQENEMSRIASKSERDALAEQERLARSRERDTSRKESLEFRKQIHADLQAERGKDKYKTPKEFGPEDAVKRLKANEEIKRRAHKTAFEEHPNLTIFMDDVTDDKGAKIGYKFKTDTPANIRNNILDIVKEFEEKIRRGEY